MGRIFFSFKKVLNFEISNFQLVLSPMRTVQNGSNSSSSNIVDGSMVKSIIVPLILYILMKLSWFSRIWFLPLQKSREKNENCIVYFLLRNILLTNNATYHRKIIIILTSDSVRIFFNISILLDSNAFLTKIFFSFFKKYSQIE